MDINFNLHELRKEHLEHIFKIISSRLNIIRIYCERNLYYSHGVYHIT